MKFIKLEMQGLWLLEPTLFQDNRGFFFESFRLNVFREETGFLEINFVQENHSSSKKGVIRGLHFQNPPQGMGKLVRCIKGSVLDVVIDLRKDSPTFKKLYSVELSAKNGLQLFVPVGFGHGFISLEDNEVVYKCDNYYHHPSDSGIQFDDPDLGIDLLFEAEERIFSEKDKKLVRLREFESPF
jgi:dTDP-4-dehydrorhamnose 3,5-epimerase